MVLACVAMLLLPSFWEGRPTPGIGAEAETPSGPPEAFPGHSTLTEEDLLPAWRGPGARKGQKDG